MEAAQTLKNGIERMLTHYVAEVTKVESVDYSESKPEEDFKH